jgi:mannan endo-1,6-alpha-mannosidase
MLLLHTSLHLATWVLLISASSVSSILLDVNDRGKNDLLRKLRWRSYNIESIRQAAALTARGVQDLYRPNTPGGMLGKWPYPPYFWWESGAAWGAMIEYSHYTGGTTYNNVTYQALTHQLSLSPTSDFNIPAEGFDTGNDDQAFWVIAAMSAAEYGFPEPPSPLPSWLQVVINAFESFVQRWALDSTTCGGGLRWQFQQSMAGWNYKNAISNSLFFQISARLARYTGNQTYVEWSHRVWNWTISIGIIDNIYNVFDGSDVLLNCTELDHHQWTYNVGAFLYGAAALSNYTNASTIWAQRTAGLLTATATFISPFRNSTDVLFEAYCELAENCNTDQLSMKAYLVRWMAGTSLLAPFTAARVNTILRASAPGAAAACSGGSSGRDCGMKWYINGSDDTTGLGQQLNAMELMYALLADQASPPMTGPQVTIAPEPTNIIDILGTATAAIPTSSATARPLFDGPKGGVTIVGAGPWIPSIIASVLVILLAGILLI